jgi:hypothetical protein
MNEKEERCNDEDEATTAKICATRRTVSFLRKSREACGKSLLFFSFFFKSLRGCERCSWDEKSQFGIERHQNICNSLHSFVRDSL